MDIDSFPRPNSMTMRRASISIFAAFMLGAATIPTIPAAPAAAAAAEDDAPPLRCPRRVGGMRLIRPQDLREASLTCRYNIPRNARGDAFKMGRVTLFAHWRADTPETRSRCVSRAMEWDDSLANGQEQFQFNLHSARRRASVGYWLTEGTRVSREQAEKAARSLLPAAEYRGHVCVPVDVDAPEDEFHCPISLGGRWVLPDWFDDDGLPTIREADELQPGARWRAFQCFYTPPYTDEDGFHQTSIDWVEGSLDSDGRRGPFCSPWDPPEIDGLIRSESAARPVNWAISSELAETGGMPMVLHLAALAAELTQLCPGATEPSSVQISAADADIEVILRALEERRVGIARLAEGAEAAGGAERTDLLAHVYREEAASVEQFARDLAETTFPESVAEVVVAAISASVTEARLWREVAADRDAIEADDIDVAIAALETRRAAVERLRRVLGVP